MNVAKWIHAEYRDFHDRPRAMLCVGHEGTFYFLCPFDDDKDDFADHYKAFRLPPLSEGQVCESWFGLETRAVECLEDIPVSSFPFDVESRAFLDYEPIRHLLRRGGYRL